MNISTETVPHLTESLPSYNSRTSLILVGFAVGYTEAIPSMKASDRYIPVSVTPPPSKHNITVLIQQKSKPWVKNVMIWDAFPLPNTDCRKYPS